MANEPSNVEHLTCPVCEHDIPADVLAAYRRQHPQCGDRVQWMASYRPPDECTTHVCTLDVGHDGEHEDWTTTNDTGEVWAWDADKVAEFHTPPPVHR